MKHKLVLSLSTFALVTLAVPAAFAETIQLNQDFCSTPCFSGASGGTVNKTLVNTSGDLTTNVQLVVSLTSPLAFHDITAFDLFFFNYTGSGSTLTGTFSAITPTGNTNTLQLTSGSFHEDGAGTFNYAVDCTGGQTHCTTTTGNNTGITGFTLLLSNNTNLTLADFDTNPAGANVSFGATVTNPTNSNCTGVIGGTFGVSGNNPPGGCNTSTTVPEPTSVLLLGTVLACLGKVLKGRLAA